MTRKVTIGTCTIEKSCAQAGICTSRHSAASTARLTPPFFAESFFVAISTTTMTAATPQTA